MQMKHGQLNGTNAAAKYKLPVALLNCECLICVHLLVARDRGSQKHIRAFSNSSSIKKYDRWHLFLLVTFDHCLVREEQRNNARSRTLSFVSL